MSCFNVETVTMSSVDSNSRVDIDEGFARIKELIGDVSGIFSTEDSIAASASVAATSKSSGADVVPPPKPMKKLQKPKKKEDKMESLLANLSSADEASEYNPIKEMNSAEGIVIRPPKGMVNTEVDDDKSKASETTPIKTKTKLGATVARFAAAFDNGASQVAKRLEKVEGVVCAPVSSRHVQGRPGCTTEGGKEDGGGALKEPSTYYVAAIDDDAKGGRNKPILEQMKANFLSGIEIMPRWMLTGIIICILLILFVVIFASVEGSPLNQSLRDYYDAKAAAAESEEIQVAFIGNSYMYVNDIPRVMESISSHKITQQSVINTAAGLGTLLKCGNGMYELWDTDKAEDVWGELDYSSITNGDDYELYDYGFCTVPQLLEGYDAYLSYRNMNGVYYSSGTNPCFMDEYYMAIVQRQSAKNPMYFDYVVLNDQTKRMANEDAREDSLDALVQAYAVLIKSAKAKPILVDTHAYLMEDGNSTLWAQYRQWRKQQHKLYGYSDLQEVAEEEAEDDYVEEQEQNQNNKNGNNNNNNNNQQEAEWWKRKDPDDIAQFTSDIYQGLYEYAEVLKMLLPSYQEPRIAKIGMTYLAIYEDNIEEWFKLFADDMIHASPHGSYLFAVVLYSTIYGHMPKPVETDNDVRKLFVNSRAMFGENLRYPTVEEANYLRKWARKVQLHGYVPKKFKQPQYREEPNMYAQLHANDTYVYAERDYEVEENPEDYYAE